MSELPKSCPKCGATVPAEAPQGLCPKCLLAQASFPTEAGPGTRHTWAPADKHGFGTAHQLGSHAYLTVRQASLSEVYHPDLSTPSFRGLQFAITDGHTFVDPPAPGEIGAVTAIALKRHGRLVAVAEPVRRGGGDARVVRPGD